VQHDARSKDKNCKDKVRIQYALNGDRHNNIFIIHITFSYGFLTALSYFIKCITTIIKEE